jgi:hypothetical protein
VTIERASELLTRALENPLNAHSLLEEGLCVLLADLRKRVGDMEIKRKHQKKK